MIHSRLLIVDDDEVDRKAIRRVLAKLSWTGQISEVANAEEARQLASTQDFDCILLDYRLPGIDGIDFLSELKTVLNVQAPVVMLTGEGNEMVAVEAMKRGAADYLPKSLLASATLLRIINQVTERSRLQRDLLATRAQMERQALYDGLSGLGNRNLFLRDLGRAIANAQRTNTSFCVLMMDLNKFKAANDQHGHAAGDAILAEVGRRLPLAGRGNDAFYRQGGDEFTALIDAADQTCVLPVAQRIAAAIAQPIDYQGTLVTVGISIGIAAYPGSDATIDRMLQCADAAMYRAKRTGQSISFATDAD